MPQWGNTESAPITGTITSANGLTLIGNGTTFTTDLSVGDKVLIGNSVAVIESISDNGEAVLTNETNIGVITAETAVTVINNRPIYIDDDSSTSAQDVYGISGDEIANNSYLTHTGWVKRTVGTGGRAGRIFNEVLVAIGISGDAGDDTLFPDSVLRFTTQPSDHSTNTTTGAAFSFVVAADSTPAGATLSYQWQTQGPGQSTYSNTADSSSAYDGSTTASLEIIPSALAVGTHLYRCVVSATNAESITSDVATLTLTVV